MYTVGFDTSALDPSFKAHAQRGIGRYVRELWRFFSAAQDLPLAIKPFSHELLKGTSLLERGINLLPMGRQTVRQQLVYPATLAGPATRGMDILHFPAHLDAPSWSPKPFMVTVLDLIPVVCADLYKADNPGWRFRFGRFLELRAIKSAKLILAISEHTAHDVNRLLGIPLDRIMVTPLGVDSKFSEVKKPSVDEETALRTRLKLSQIRKIILYVGGIDQRKNWQTLLSTMEILSAGKGEEAPLLVMAGKIDTDLQYPKLLAQIELRGLAQHVRLCGYLDEAELLRLYGISSVFFFPSLYEGFGLTPLEALAAGVPVVSSNASAMPEVLGDAAMLVDPLDSKGFAAAITTILHDGERARLYAERGRKRAQSFTWERTGVETVRAYQRCASGDGL